MITIDGLDGPFEYDDEDEADDELLNTNVHSLLSARTHREV